MKIVIIGPYPTPIGGVSIHIKRLFTMFSTQGMSVELIDESPKSKSGIFNLRSLNIFKYFKILISADLVHIHSSITVFRLFNIICSMFLGKKIIVTLHSWRINRDFVKHIQRALFSKVDTVICVNNFIKESVDLENAIVQPAFLPPDMDAEPVMPSHISSWIKKQKEDDAVIISSNAYRLDKFDGFDLYGLDMAINLIEYLTNIKIINVALVFIVTTLQKNDIVFNSYLKEIERRGLKDNILLLHEENVSFVRLIEASDLTLRATNTDGDALSIRESIYLGKPVVASDVVERPEDTLLFKTRNQEDLNSVVLIAIRQLNINTVKTTSKNEFNSIYKKLYKIS